MWAGVPVLVLQPRADKHNQNMADHGMLHAGVLIGGNMEWLSHLCFVLSTRIDILSNVGFNFFFFGWIFVSLVWPLCFFRKEWCVCMSELSAALI